MARGWRHPEIGVLRKEPGDPRWQKEFDNPWKDELRFDEFADEVPEPGDPEPNRDCFLAVDSEGPDEGAAEQLDAFWSDRESLASKLCEALWADLNGQLATGNSWAGRVGELDYKQGGDTAKHASLQSAEQLADHLAVCGVVVLFIPEEKGQPQAKGAFSGFLHDRDPHRIGPPRPGFWAVAIGLVASWHDDFFIVLWRNGQIIGIGDREDYIDPAAGYVPE